MLILVLLWFTHIKLGLLLIPFLDLSLLGIILKLHLLVNHTGVPSNTRYAFQIGILASFMQSLSLSLCYYYYLFILIIVIIIILLIISFILPLSGIVWLRWKQTWTWWVKSLAQGLSTIHWQLYFIKTKSISNDSVCSCVLSNQTLPTYNVKF